MKALMTLGKFVLHSHGMTITGTPTFEEFQAIGDWLRVCHGAVQWWWGDWLAYGDSRPDYAERLSQALDTSGYEARTLSHLKYVAERVDPIRRRSDVPFSHHVEVACLPPAEQETILAKCADDCLSVQQTRQAVRVVNGKAESLLWVVVGCADAADQTALYNRMVAEGRPVKFKMTAKEPNG